MYSGCCSRKNFINEEHPKVKEGTWGLVTRSRRQETGGSRSDLRAGEPCLSGAALQGLSFRETQHCRRLFILGWRVWKGDFHKIYSLLP